MTALGTGIPDRQLPRVPGPAYRKANTGLVGRISSTPDHASFDWGPGGFRWTIHVGVASWRPGFTHWFCAQGDHVFGMNLSIAFSQHVNGTLRTAITPDGVNFIGPESTLPVPIDTPRDYWLRTDVFPSFGGATDFSYFTSPDGWNWSALGQTNLTTGAGITLFNSTADLQIPGQFVDVPQAQVTYEAKFESTLLFGGVPVAWPRFDTLNPKLTAFTDEKGRTWTQSGTGLIATIN